uniref:Uncharacterized protein n=1 Tax=Oryza brachyantha TaxID=4533 RepID=J3M227_ORYBR
MLTTASLVLNLGDGPLGPPVNGLRQRLVVGGEVPAGDLALPPRLAPEAEVGGAVLLVGEVGEPVEAEAERVDPGVGGRVVLVDVAEVVPEHQVPPLLLPDAVVVLAVLRLPLRVQPPRLLLAPLPVRHDRHIRRRCHGQQQQQRGRRESHGNPHLAELGEERPRKGGRRSGVDG